MGGSGHGRLQTANRQRALTERPRELPGRGSPALYGRRLGERPGQSTDGGYCVYQSPSPYESDYVANIYNANTVPQTCFTPCTNPLGCNITTPTSDQFTKWGEADADNTLFDNSSYVGAARNIAIGASLAAVGTVGSVAAGLGTTFSLGSTLAQTSFQEAVFTYAARV